MDIKKTLLVEHSRFQTERVAKYIGSDTIRFKELMELVFSKDVIVTQRAAWVMCLCFEKHSSLVHPYLKKMIYTLEKEVHDSVKRNMLKILQTVDIPISLLGKTADSCFKLLAKSSEAIAIKVFAMTVLLAIVRKETTLKNELRISIEDQLPYASAGFISRGKKVLKSLEKIN